MLIIESEIAGNLYINTWVIMQETLVGQYG